MKVLVIAETNWIEDIALAQDLRSAYLLELRDKGYECDLKVFYTADREDFDNEMIYTELEEIDVKLYFDAGEVVERIYEGRNVR
jgi:hypothetical protein